MNYIVYKTTNLINGKIYVGVHRTNPDVNDGYIGCGVTRKDQKKNKMGFPQAVKKYGYDNFKRETIQIFPDTEEGHNAAYALEAEIVNEEFIKRKDTYNLALGGKFTAYENIKKKIAQYSIDGKFIRTWDSITEAEETLGLNSIYAALVGISKYCGEYQWRYYEENTDDIEKTTTKERKVYQFDLQGNLLKVWKTAVEASKEFENPNSARAAIGNCCNGRTRQSFGYYWSYTNKFNYMPYGTPVAKYNDAGEFLESYTTMTEAAKANGIKGTANIIAAISGKQKHCGGYRWKYFYGNTSNIKPLIR